jgi:hypothetical protein
MFKEYEITCMVVLTLLGRCCRYCCLLNKQRAFKILVWWNFRGGMDREKGKLIISEDF